MSFPTEPLTLDNLGGAKDDWIDVVDPRYDRSSAEVNTAFNAVAMTSRTCIQARVKFRNDGSGFFTVSHQALWGDSLAYEPTYTNAATGEIVVSFPASVTDDMGNVVEVNINEGWASLEDTWGFCSVQRVAANSVKVKLANTSGSASQFLTHNINLWVV